MIKSFKLKGLRDFWTRGDLSGVRPDLAKRLLRRLDVLNNARQPTDMNVPGFDFHKLQGTPERFSVHVNGPWCVTFGWQENDAIDVDLVQYH